MEHILREMIENALTVSRRILEEGGELVPMFHVGKLRPEPSLHIVAAPFHGETLEEANRTKDAAAFQVAKLAKETEAEFIFMITEG